MKDSEILREAKRMIEGGEDRFICCALENVTYSKDASIKSSVIGLKQWIHTMLEGYTTLESWLIVKRDVKDADNPRYAKRVRFARMRWLDWMIAYCEAEESK